MCIRYIDEVEGIEKEIDFKPEIYIYIKKLMEERSKTFDETVNDIITEHAINKMKDKSKDNIIYVPYIQQTTPTTVPMYKYGINTTTSNPKNTTNYTSSYDNSTLFTFDYKPKRM